MGSLALTPSGFVLLHSGNTKMLTFDQLSVCELSVELKKLFCFIIHYSHVGQPTKGPVGSWACWRKPKAVLSRVIVTLETQKY